MQDICFKEDGIFCYTLHFQFFKQINFTELHQFKPYLPKKTFWSCEADLQIWSSCSVIHTNVRSRMWPLLPIFFTFCFLLVSSHSCNNVYWITKLCRKNARNCQFIFQEMGNHKFLKTDFSPNNLNIHTADVEHCFSTTASKL